MSQSELYENESDIPTADADEPDPESQSTVYLSGIKYAFIAFLLGAGLSGVLGISTLYSAVMPNVLGVVFAVLVALDARQLTDWGGTKYLWALASLIPPFVLGYYFRRGSKTA